MSLALITCGPASEPIDAVRQITNFSTGELGVLLAEGLQKAGHAVVCYKGKKAVWPDPAGVKVEHFGANSDLLALLTRQAGVQQPAMIFHVAALADFRIAAITDSQGLPLSAGKISSKLPEIHLRLVQAPKILPVLHQLFPKSRIIAWKYEVEEGREEAVNKGRRQLTIPGVVASVINGPAYGSGFGLLTQDGLSHYPDKSMLVLALGALAAPVAAED